MNMVETGRLTKRVLDWVKRLPWAAEGGRPEATIVPVRDAFVLARALVARWLGTASVADATSDGFDRAVAAIPSCALDDVGQRDQGARYARLSTSVEHVQREPEAVVIEFVQGFDRQTLTEALAVERECCPFFRFRFDQRRRRLRVTVADADMLPALEAIAAGFGAAQARHPEADRWRAGDSRSERQRDQEDHG